MRWKKNRPGSKLCPGSAMHVYGLLPGTDPTIPCSFCNTKVEVRYGILVDHPRAA